MSLIVWCAHSYDVSFRRERFEMVGAQPQCAAAECYPLVRFARAALYAARFRNMFVHVDL